MNPEAVAEGAVLYDLALPQGHQQTSQLKALFDGAPAGMALTEGYPPYRVQIHNRAFQQFLPEPLRAKGAIGLGIDEIVPPEGLKQLTAICDEVVRTCKPKALTNFEFHGLPRGTTWWNWYLSPVLAEGKPVALVHVGIEITKQVRARREAEHLAAWHRTFFETVSDGLLLYGPSGEVVEANRPGLAIHGFRSLEEMNALLRHRRDSMRLLDIRGNVIPPDQWPTARSLRGETVANFEARIVRIDTGRKVYVNIASIPVAGSEGHVQSVVCTVRDVSSQVLARRRIEDLITRYAAVFDNVGDALMLFDAQGTAREVNPAALRMHGFRDTQEARRSLESYAELFELHYIYGGLIPLEQWPIMRALRGERVTGFEARTVRKDNGEEWYGSHSAAPIHGFDGALTGAALSIRDVSDKKRDELTRERLLYQLRAVMENMTEALVIVDPVTNAIYHNPASRTLHGYNTVEEGGLAKDEWEQQWEVRDSTGRILAPDERPMSRALRGERFGGYEVRARRLDTGEEFIGSYGGTPVNDRWGNQIVALLTIRDITREKQAEEELVASSSKLRESARRKDDFLAILGHELRNPLSVLENNIELLRNNLLDPAEASGAFAMMSKQVGMLSHLVDDLLDLSRITRGRMSLQPQTVTIGETVAAAEKVVSATMRARQHEFVCSVGSADTRLRADPLRLEQILANLLTNAAKYTDPGGRVWLRGYVEDDTVCLEVSDTGRGLAPDQLESIFEPFSQAVTGSGGLGIGLSLVRELVSLHEGEVRVESEGIGLGSTFTVRLPVAQPAEEPLPCVVQAEEDAIAGMRVLLVEDNEAAAWGLTRLLSRKGFVVKTAAGGAEACDVAEAFVPHVVLLDIGLPDMDGYQVAEALRQRPVTREATIFATTGYSDDVTKARIKEGGFDGHLTKPLKVNDFLEALSRKM